MEERKNEEVLYKLSPRFSFIYELFMPTGRKIKSTIGIMIIMFIITIFLFVSEPNINATDMVMFGDMSIMSLLKNICIIADILLIVKLAFHIIIQAMQYKHITYTFYKTHMVYEDDFLNQHRKNIEYSNIKEVEIRRTIFDRILGYGVIVIYTNAENSRNNGLVIYAIKNPKYSYEIIDSIVHKEKELKPEVISNVESENTNEAKDEKEFVNNYSSEQEIQKRVEENKKEEEAFLDSLKNVNDGDENV